MSSNLQKLKFQRELAEKAYKRAQAPENNAMSQHDRRTTIAMQMAKNSGLNLGECIAFIEKGHW